MKKTKKMRNDNKYSTFEADGFTIKLQMTKMIKQKGMIKGEKD